MVRKTPSTHIERQSFLQVWHARYVWYVNFFGTYDTPVSLKRRTYERSILLVLMAHDARRTHQNFRHLRHVGQSIMFGILGK